MKLRSFFGVLLFTFLAGGNLFSFGKAETAEDKAPVNTEWILCITAPDTSALSPARQVIGETVARSFAGVVSKLRLRFRNEEEAGYYRDAAWAKSRTDAAKALQTKRNERDLLIFRGDPSWKYRKSLKTVDEAIVKLEAALAEAEDLAPPVERKPALRLSEKNRNGTYPPPPAPGGELKFCATEKADAFLSGTLSEYHGRIYLNIKMYTLHTGSFSFEESILFTPEELTAAVDELSGRLAAAVSSTLPAAVLVHAAPPEAVVLIDGSNPAPDEPHYHSPGTAEITVRADNYLPVALPLELNSGELAELFIDLSPMSLAAFEAEVPQSPGSRVYLGGLYMGETPLTLELPRTQFSYVSVETPEGEIASMVYQNNEMVRGSAQFIRADGDEAVPGKAIFETRPPISPEEKRVDRARRGFYGAYGAFWFVLPAALITAGIAQNHIYANNHVVANNLYPDDYDKRKTIFDRATLGSNITIGAYSAMGLALGVTFFQIFRYLYVSGGDATPIVRSPPPRMEE